MPLSGKTTEADSGTRMMKMRGTRCVPVTWDWWQLKQKGEQDDEKDSMELGSDRGAGVSWALSVDGVCCIRTFT